MARVRGKIAAAARMLAIAALCAMLIGPWAAAQAQETLPPYASRMSRGQRILSNLTVFHNLLIWPVDRTISVCFFPDQQIYRQLVVDGARRWEAAANIHFDPGAPPWYRTCDKDSQSGIRVQLLNRHPRFAAGSSALGTMALQRSASQPTLVIATQSRNDGSPLRRGDLERTILHELGHALGLPHEHQHPSSRCIADIDLEAICTARPAAGVDPRRAAEFRQQLAAIYQSQPRRLDPVPVWDVPYDVASIMHYPFPPQYLRNGSRSSCVTGRSQGLSEGDLRRVALLYPRSKNEQDAFLLQQVAVFQRTIKALGVSAGTAAEMARFVRQNLHPDHQAIRLQIGAMPSDLPTNASPHEEELANLLLPPLPAACKGAALPLLAPKPEALPETRPTPFPRPPPMK